MHTEVLKPTRVNLWKRQKRINNMKSDYTNLKFVASGPQQNKSFSGPCLKSCFRLVLSEAVTAL